MKSIHFFPKDPRALSLPKGATAEPHAIFTTDMVHVLETPAISGMYVTNIVGPTKGVTANPCSSQSSENGQEIEILTREAQSPATSIESDNSFAPLPTPFYIQKLENTLSNHPDQQFVSRLCNYLRYGADVGFTGRRIGRFSRNLPTARSQPSIVTENLSREVALGLVAGPFPSPPLPNFQVSPIGVVPKKHTAKFRTIFHLSYPKSGETSINSSIPKMISAFSILQLIMQSKGFLVLARGVSLRRRTLSLLFASSLFDPQITSFLGCAGRVATTTIRSSPSG